MHILRRLVAGAAVTGLVVSAGLFAGATVASAATIGSCSSGGEFAICAASGTAHKPLRITVTVKANPNQTVDVNWSIACSAGNSVSGSSGGFTATTPVTRTIHHPFHHPGSCDVTAGAGLLNGSGSIHVKIRSYSTAPVHTIRGYDGKCVNAQGSAKGAAIALRTCDHAASENWAFRNGELVNDGKCATDENDRGRGGKVVINRCTRAAKDHWTHRPDGEYVLAAHSGRLCLDDPGRSRANGTQLIVYACRNTANQRWTLP